MADSKLERAKEADLVTLPEDVKGTNCGNCEYSKNGYCYNKKVDQEVNPRMCCALWDAKGTKRAWETEKSELVKSPYGPKGMGLYSDADNARRKMDRSSLGRTRPTVSQQAAKDAAEAKAKSKQNPVRRFKPHEIRALMRNGFKLPKAV